MSPSVPACPAEAHVGTGLFRSQEGSRLAYPNGTEATYAYGAASQLRELRHKRQGSTETLALAQYDYDSAGNRTQMTDLTGTHFYGYDELHRATAAVHPSASMLEIKHEVFDYDDVGNRLADAQATGYAYDRANRLLEDSLHTYCNDLNGNRTCKVVKATGDRTDYVYDSENQLIQVRNSTGTFNYKYDGLGRRIEKSSGTTPSQVTRYVYDNEDILAMLDGANNLIAVFGHGPGIDEPLMIRHADGTEYFMHADGLGSISAHSSTASVVIERVEYEVYGLPIFGGTATTSSSPFAQSAFAGMLWELETRSYFDKARNLDPLVGRFPQEDPADLAALLQPKLRNALVQSRYFVAAGATSRFPHDLLREPQQLNQFSYAQNEPVRFLDPFGTDPIIAPPALLGVPPWIAAAAAAGIVFYGAYGIVANAEVDRQQCTIRWQPPLYWNTPLPYPVGLELQGRMYPFPVGDSIIRLPGIEGRFFTPFNPATPYARRNGT